MIKLKEGFLINDGSPRYLSSEGEKLFSLTEWWIYKDSDKNNWVVPPGFVYDLASIPSWIWWLQWGGWNTAAVAHDWIYIFGYLLKTDHPNNKLIKVKFSKLEADKFFADVC